MKNTLKIIAVTLLFIIPLNLFSNDLSKGNKIIVKEKINESELKIENWMLRPFVNYLDEPLEVEDWMLKPFFDEGSNLFMFGITDTNNEYYVYYLDEKFPYNGHNYTLYKVVYNDIKDIKLAHYKNSYILINDGLLIFYGIKNNIFGAERILFNNKSVCDKYDYNEYKNQIYLSNKVNNKESIEIIVNKFPKLLKK